MKKRILFVSHAAYPLFNEDVNYPYGGAELDLYNLSLALNKDLFDVHFIVGDFGQEKTEKQNDITIHRAASIENHNFLKGFFNFAKLAFLIKKINPDVYFTEAAGWLTVELIIIKLLFRKKIVFRSAHIRNINGYLDRKPYGKLFRKLINHIDLFILQNEEDRNIFKKTYPYKKRVLCIRNFQEIPDTNNRFSERNYILWIGRSEKIKKPELFLELAKKIPDKNFLMIMPKTNTKIFYEILNMAKSIANLKIIVGICQSKILDFHKKALYFVSTSESEGFPNVILEAMKTATPIISYFLDYDRIIQTNNCGLVSLGKEDAIVNFINSTQEDKWTNMSNSCYNFAVNNFDITKGIKKYEDVFIQL